MGQMKNMVEDILLVQRPGRDTMTAVNLGVRKTYSQESEVASLREYQIRSPPVGLHLFEETTRLTPMNVLSRDPRSLQIRSASLASHVRSSHRRALQQTSSPFPHRLARGAIGAERLLREQQSGGCG